MYGNEQGVGEAVRASGLDRADVFITSKLNNGFHRPDEARRAFAQTLERAGDRVRRPVPDPLALADSLRRRLRLDVEDARGVPPGRPRTLDRGLELPGRAPRTPCRRVRRRAGGEPDRAASVFRQLRGRRLRPGARDRDRGAGRRSRRARFSTTRRSTRSPTGLGKSPAQVALRWHIQRGNIVFPKSTTPARIKENFELFDFQLEPGDVEKIDALDRGEAGRDGPNPDGSPTFPPERPASARCSAQ